MIGSMHQVRHDVLSFTVAMAIVESIPGISDLLQLKVVEERKTHECISQELKALYPGTSGLSSRSIRRFCERHNIHATSRLIDSELDRVVSSSNGKVLLM